jgi:hypothetical protein
VIEESSGGREDGLTEVGKPPFFGLLLRPRMSATVVAATRVKAPFTYDCVFADPHCRPGGLNIDLFRSVMGVLGLEYRFVRAEEAATGYLVNTGGML